MRRSTHSATLAACLAAAVLGWSMERSTTAAVPDEFRVKREAEFAFAAPPRLVRDERAFRVEFATTAFCDVTVAIEDGEGRIVRHLASGVLGENAPPPFEQRSKRQSVLWDGKDDAGRYIDDLDGLSLRVSLGLKPEFEKALFWSPKKRIARQNPPLIAAVEEGVLVCEGEGRDSVVLFDHAGNYVRTIYPFPADKLAEVQGLNWVEFPQDEQKLPLKYGLVQATLLNSGRNTGDGTLAKYQPAATAFAARGKRIAVVSERLNRLATDGTSGGLDIVGPETSITLLFRNKETSVVPRSAAFDPGGEALYLTGYEFFPETPQPHHWIPCVLKMDFASDEKPTLFAGSLEIGGSGSEPGQFRAPMSVACDAQGRVYVADYANDRIQVFAAEGKFLKAVPVRKPAAIGVHPANGEIFVGSWNVLNQFSGQDDVKDPKITRLGAFDDPRELGSWPMPLFEHHPAVFMNKLAGLQHNFAVDPHTEPVTFWLVPGAAGAVSKLHMVRGQMASSPEAASLKLYQAAGDKLALVRDFGKEVAEAIERVQPPVHSRQKLYVDPVSGKLYVFEGQAGVAKSVVSLLEIDPRTEAIRDVPLPFDAEDLAFDANGLLYLRTDNVVGRFQPEFGADPRNWQEVPFDYGEERPSVGFSSSGDGRRANLIGGLVMPALRPGCFHQGGMAVSVNGSLVVPCYNDVQPPARRDEAAEIVRAGEIAAGKQYTPPVYPGRIRYNEVHVWDRHGKLLHEDAVPGAPLMDGIAIDGENSIYMMVAPNRVLGGQPYFLERAETLIKVRPKQARLVTDSDRVPLPLAKRPTDPPALRRGGNIWIEGADWLYGGVGFGGFNSSKGGGGCACWHARFALDFFARSFAPEVDHYSVAVLDSAGNLITRIGRYGNADSAGPSSAVPLDGDGVGLFHAAYVAAHTDHRLFIADVGNSRLISVKLGYHASERLPLRSANQGDGR
ncbi:MAG: hypothetical protein WED34_11770 [Planctomycetales bacterium]